MPSIISYRKASDDWTVYELEAPDGATELCTLDDVTYVSLPDGVTLGTQPTQIADSVQAVTLDDALRDQLRDASPHIALIRRRVRDKIAERYQTSDEIKMLRTMPSADFDAYNAYVQSCQAWGDAQKALLGL